MLFEELIGNERAKELLEKLIQTRQILHSYLFVGQEGIGKKHFAIEFVKGILCIEEQNRPCGKCKSCLEFEGENHPDFSIIVPDGKIKIEQIRMMQTKILEKPIISEKKVYIIDDADKMTTEAQNCLLKTLEEPPSYITIILVTANKNKLLTTITSRCTDIHFQAIEEQQLRDYLQEKMPDILVSNTMMKMYHGSIAKAMMIGQKKEQYEKLENIAKRIETANQLEMMSYAEVFIQNKEEISNLLDYFNVLLLEKAKENLSTNQKYLTSMQLVEKIKRRIEGNSNLDMSIDKLLIEIWEEINS